MVVTLTMRSRALANPLCPNHDQVNDHCIMRLVRQATHLAALYLCTMSMYQTFMVSHPGYA